MAMRHRYALLLGLLLPAGRIAAQCTPVDCLGSLPAWGGLCQSAFVDGRVGQPYADVISFHVTNACTPASLFDPTLTTASVRITQINSIAFSQLPAGLTGASNQPTYTPPVNGCGSLSGTPTEAGVFEATVDMSVNVNVWPFSLTCGGFGPIANNNNPVSFAVDLVILPDPSFTAPAAPLCIADAAVQLIPTGTPGGVFSGPGVSGDLFDPALAGIGLHEVKYTVSAQQGAAIAPATDSLSVFIEVNDDCLGACDAFAGTLGALDFIPCINPGESVELVGIPGGDAVVPPGFEVVYVLTQGAGLVIVGAASQPVFEVSDLGLHTLHTLVYDPATLDLGLIELGTTTGFDVNALLIQGGGAICASLDVNGAAYVVEACSGECLAVAGTMSGGGVACLENELATLLAEANDDAEVPPGFVRIYLLTQGAGLLIIDDSSAPSFVVSELGEYRIHSLVIDPVIFALAVTPGLTTAAELLDYIASTGECADLDAEGAAFLVEVCSSLAEAPATGFSLHPNPSAGGFFVVPDADGAALLELIDVSGRVAHTERIACARGSAAWVETAAAPGSYVVRLTLPAGRWEQRLAVQR
jgi:hypothetical protein